MKYSEQCGIATAKGNQILGLIRRNITYKEKEPLYLCVKQYEQWAGTIGRFGTRETNDKGIRLLEFASTQKLTSANTLHPHRLSMRTT